MTEMRPDPCRCRRCDDDEPFTACLLGDAVKLRSVKMASSSVDAAPAATDATPVDATPTAAAAATVAATDAFATLSLSRNEREHPCWGCGTPAPPLDQKAAARRCRPQFPD